MSIQPEMAAGTASACSQSCMPSGVTDTISVRSSASSGGAEGNDCFAAQIRCIEEGIHYTGLSAPPNGEADIHRIVSGHIGDIFANGRAAAEILHFDCTAGLLVCPVKIRNGIKSLGSNLIQVCPCNLCYQTSSLSIMRFLNHWLIVVKSPKAS